MRVVALVGARVSVDLGLHHVHQRDDGRRRLRDLPQRQPAGITLLCRAQHQPSHSPPDLILDEKCPEPGKPGSLDSTKPGLVVQQSCVD